MDKLDLELYDIFSDKTLKKWCVISDWKYNMEIAHRIQWDYYWAHSLNSNFSASYNIWKESHLFIVWCEPRIEDIYKKSIIDNTPFISQDILMEIWYRHHKTLLEQESETKLLLIKMFK